MAFQWVYLANLTGPAGDAAALGRFNGIDARLDALEVGTPLTSGANLNSLFTPGLYRAETYLIARSIIGTPAGTKETFFVEVRRLSAASNVFLQTLTEWTADGPLVSYRVSLQGVYPAWGESVTLGRSPLAAGANLNTLLTPGRYRAESNTIAQSVIGAPDGIREPFTIDVTRISGGAIVYMQELSEWSFAGPVVSRRVSNQGTFGPWFKELEASRTRISCAGDSLTAGQDVSGAWPASAKWPTILGTLLPGVTVANLGRGGDTTDDILIRLGAQKLWFTVPTGTIPASGSVAIATRAVVSTRDNISYIGSLAGVPGTINTGTGRSWTFTRTTAGDAVPVAGQTPFIPTGTARDRETIIFWGGRNDMDFGTSGQEQSKADHIVAQYQAVVEWAQHQAKQVMLVGVTTSMAEHPGALKYETIREINNRLRNLYPGKFADVQNYLVNRALGDMGLTPTSADTAAVAAGEIPPQLYAAGDGTHFSRATAAALAQYFFEPYLRGKGWV